jgi:hypothetical protein
MKHEFAEIFAAYLPTTTHCGDEATIMMSSMSSTEPILILEWIHRAIDEAARTSKSLNTEVW